MIEYDVRVINKSALEKLDKLGQRGIVIEQKLLKRISQGIISYVQTEKLRGQVLKRRSGNLVNSLQYRLTGPHSIAIGPGMIYSAIHEFGGEIVPVNGKYLRFEIGGREIFAKKVKIPARPYLAPGIAEYLVSGKCERLVDLTLQEEIDKL